MILSQVRTSNNDTKNDLLKENKEILEKQNISDNIDSLSLSMSDTGLKFSSSIKSSNLPISKNETVFGSHNNKSLSQKSNNKNNLPPINEENYMDNIFADKITS